jgi:hypothetical protein
MPRIAAALAVLAAVAFCIGFNTVRYPVVWEILKQPGLPSSAAKPADTVAPAAPTAGAPQQPATSAQASAPAAKRADKGPKPESKAATQADSQAEFCTADGVCTIAGGAQQAKKPGPPPTPDSAPQGRDSPPHMPRDAPLGGLGNSDAGAPPAAKDAMVKRRLVPVTDAPAAGPSPVIASGAASGSVLGAGRGPLPSAGAADSAGDARLRPLPPVDELAAASPGPAPPPATASAPFYPTTGQPAVGLTGLESGNTAKLVPVSQHGP